MSNSFDRLSETYHSLLTASSDRLHAERMIKNEQNRNLQSEKVSFPKHYNIFSINFKFLSR